MITMEYVQLYIADVHGDGQCTKDKGQTLDANKRHFWAQLSWNM